MTMSRRSLLVAASALGAILPAGRLLAETPLNAGAIEEDQKGDTDTPYERLIFSQGAIEQFVTGSKRASFEPRRKEFPKHLVTTARKFVGKNRHETPEEIAQFLDLFDLPFRWPDGTFVPFCASGLSHVAALAYAELLHRPSGLSTYRNLLADLEHHWFFPTPSVRFMALHAEAKQRLKVVTAQEKPKPKPGWIVIYNFGKGYDHCGIVVNANVHELHTIEFNTAGTVHGNQRNSGVVAERKRRYGQVRAFIETTRSAT